MNDRNIPEKCLNFDCRESIHERGNLSYGASKLAEGIKRYALIFYPVYFVGAILALNYGPIASAISGSSKGFACYMCLACFVPLCLLYLLAALLPKSTVITCHKCGRVDELYGVKPALSALPPAINDKLTLMKKR